MDLQNKLQTATPTVEKMVHLALPVRWSLLGQEGRGAVETACTYDIHPHGARLLSSRLARVGDMVMVERGRNKAVCQVIWAADAESVLRGQFAVRCVGNRTPWDDELRQMEEQYQPIVLDHSRFSSRVINLLEANRRRRPRFYVEGQAELIDRSHRVAGEVEEISEFGARISAMEALRPGRSFRLTLSLCEVSLALKVQVRYLVNNLGIGVEFQEIRRGDRPLLNYVLSQLKHRRVEQFAPVEVIREPLPALAQ
jgi:hypothetical protein